MVGFDISADELPIFLAEADENLQSLDKSLLILEKNNGNEEDIQTAFRAAHTLKGMAGMIGHEDMVAVTHALETVFDLVRRKSLNITPAVIDACLNTVDSLRLLRNEVETSEPSGVNVDTLVTGLENILHQGHAAELETHLKVTTQRSSKKKTAQPKVKKPTTQKRIKEFYEAKDGSVPVMADISPKSVASAARVFQLILVLQEIGKITFQEPAMEVVDSALPIQQFKARVKTAMPLDEIKKRLKDVSEVDRLFVGKDEIADSKNPAKSADYSEERTSPKSYEMLGEYLVKQKVITEDQLQSALVKQKKGNGKKLFGEVLVEMGLISQERMDEEIKAMIREQKMAGVQEVLKTPAQKSNVSEMTVRTSVEHLNALLGMAGELITDRNHLNRLRSRFELGINQHRDVEELSQTVSHLGRITDQLQEEVLSIRMLPVSNLFEKFPRMVRDLSHKMNKEIELVIHGEETELDRSMIEEISDPIIHLIRNSIDHGIESSEVRKATQKPEVGRITLSAEQEQGHIIITVEDDGQGIDTKALRKIAVNRGLVTQEAASRMTDEEATNLIFISGLSTSKTVTDISGRGVGMDIVRNNIQHINGTISVESKSGVGTQFQIVLPLTLAIVPTMLVDLGGTTFAFPLVMVAEILRLEEKDIHYVRGNPVTKLRDTILPLISLNEVFSYTVKQREKVEWKYVVVIHYGKIQAGIIVDRLLGQEEVVVKSLGSLVGDVQGISSAAILGDGHVALIIDVSSLLKSAGIH